MKISEILSDSNPRILRNGKVVISKKKNIKKKSKLKTKNENQLSFYKTNSKDLNKLHYQNTDKSYEVAVTTNYSHLIDNYGLYKLFNDFPFSIINGTTQLIYEKNKNSNKNCYTSLEDYIQLNEVQIYNELAPKIRTIPELITKKGTDQNVELLNNNLKPKIYNSLTTQNSDVRITRGKSAKQKIEERKQLDQLFFNKFPNNSFNTISIQLDDITEKVKFLQSLGLIFRFKCSLFNCKTKKKN